jgi:hypothetical protein
LKERARENTKSISAKTIFYQKKLFIGKINVWSKQGEFPRSSTDQVNDMVSAHSVHRLLEFAAMLSNDNNSRISRGP